MIDNLPPSSIDYALQLCEDDRRSEAVRCIYCGGFCRLHSEKGIWFCENVPYCSGELIASRYGLQLPLRRATNAELRTLQRSVRHLLELLVTPAAERQRERWSRRNMKDQAIADLFGFLRGEPTWQSATELTFEECHRARIWIKTKMITGEYR